jgi:flagellar basal-body rod protein FlgC
MLEGISSALTGLAAATRRLEASANNIANANSYGSIPASDAAEQRDAYLPVRVEQSSAPGGGTATGDRYVRPAYIPVFDTSSAFSNSDGLVAAPNVDIASEIIEQIGAEQSFEANLKSVQSISDMVKKLYDLTE